MRGQIEGQNEPERGTCCCSISSDDSARRMSFEDDHAVGAILFFESGHQLLLDEVEKFFPTLVPAASAHRQPRRSHVVHAALELIEIWNADDDHLRHVAE